MNEYNANMYLATNMLNNIENQIEDVTSNIEEYVFSDTVNNMKNIEVGDNLNDKMLYLSFPRDIYETETSDYSRIIKTDKNNSIYVSKDEGLLEIFIIYRTGFVTLYLDENNNKTPTINMRRFKLPHDFGIVTNVDNSSNTYQHINIYSNEFSIPHYEKHTWQDNELLSMQKLDNIEEGIKNIGYYYYKPMGWITERDWLQTFDMNILNIFLTSENTFESRGLNVQNISYHDLNRWINNLNLVDFTNLNNMTLWNTNVTQIIWNENNSDEWEDL